MSRTNTKELYSYDTSCEELARHFLSDNKDASVKHVRDLAQHIQTSVEDWIEYQSGLKGTASDTPTARSEA